MHPTECMMSFLQTVHVRNSTVGGGELYHSEACWKPEWWWKGCTYC